MTKEQLKASDLVSIQSIMDKQSVPSIGRMLWNPETEEIEYIAPMKNYSMEDLKKLFPVK